MAFWNGRLEVTLQTDYTYGMSTKEIALASIQGLPDSATWEDIEERIRFLAAIEKGRKDIREGKVVPHEDVRNQLDRWLSK